LWLIGHFVSGLSPDQGVPSLNGSLNIIQATAFGQPGQQAGASRALLFPEALGPMRKVMGANGIWASS